MKEKIKSEFTEKLVTLITAAFGLVAAFAWNDTVKAIFAKVYPNGQNIWAMVIYASFVTMMAVVAALVLSRISKKK